VSVLAICRTVPPVWPSLRRLIEERVQSRVFFKYFKVNLANECPFWTVEGKCSSEGDCTRPSVHSAARARRLH
jgi:hypothetical protein